MKNNVAKKKLKLWAQKNKKKIPSSKESDDEGENDRTIEIVILMDLTFDIQRLLDPNLGVIRSK